MSPQYPQYPQYPQCAWNVRARVGGSLRRGRQSRHTSLSVCVFICLLFCLCFYLFCCFVCVFVRYCSILFHISYFSEGETLADFFMGPSWALPPHWAGIRKHAGQKLPAKNAGQKMSAKTCRHEPAAVSSITSRLAVLLGAGGPIGLGARPSLPRSVTLLATACRSWRAVPPSSGRGALFPATMSAGGRPHDTPRSGGGDWKAHSF